MYLLSTVETTTASLEQVRGVKILLKEFDTDIIVSFDESASILQQDNICLT